MASSTGTVTAPRIDEIRLVEEHVRTHSGEYRRRALWQTLPCRIPYGTFRQVIERLQETAKIGIDADGNVCWIHNPALFREYIDRDDLRLA